MAGTSKGAAQRDRCAVCAQFLGSSPHTCGKPGRVPKAVTLWRSPEGRAHRAQYVTAWRKAHPERAAEIAKRWRDRKKAQVVAHYGGRCACCGECESAFLTIDHIAGDGGQERRDQNHRGGIATYRRLVATGFPPGYRVLCWNCNLAVHVLGVCPHRGGVSGPRHTSSPTGA